MKQCTKCKEWKDESEYFADKRIKSGIKSYCKECCKKQRRAYRQTENGKKKIKAWWQSEKGKDLRLKRREADTQKVTRYHQTEAGKKTHQQSSVRYRQRHKNKIAAHNAIRVEKSRGSMPPASELQCNICGNQANYYHHPDYSKPLEVIPVCSACHANIHNN